MDRLVLKAEKRKLGSKSHLNQLRQAGKVPAVLHNRGEESTHIYVDSLEFKKALHTSAGMNVLLNLDISGEKTQLARIEDIQYDILREGVYVHIDFGSVSLDQKIEVDVPILLTGQEERANDEGIVSQVLHEVTLLSSPDSIPDNLSVDIRNLTIGDALHVGDLELPSGCEAVTELEETIVSITPPRLEEEAEDEEDEEGEAVDALGEEEDDVEPEIVE